ncbi:MAG: N-formylglutamate amidohydrolase [Alphaproteobacteria bacterium]|nr:N-formylglutamate amidohydrolase [Alphaproteobacteria bacterium]
MDAAPTPFAELSQVLEILAPARQTNCVIFASPHSGTDYPPEFVAGSALDPATLRKSEDSFVDELFASAPLAGAPLLRALFPRAYLDPNREPWELDPQMFEDAVPEGANTRSARVMAGLGTIPRVVATGAEIYRGKLRFAEAERRIRTLYDPYHDALRNLVETTRARFGCCLLVDCHSMPSAGRGDVAAGVGAVDMVVGDCFGTACAPLVTDTVERTLRGQGYRVLRNSPYAGGFTTRHWGRPAQGLHAVQVEINRRLYMDEGLHRRSDRFAAVAAHVAALVAALTAISPAELTMPR